MVVKGQTNNSNKYYTFHVLLPHYQLYLNQKNNNQLHYQNRIINYLLSTNNTKKKKKTRILTNNFECDGNGHTKLRI